MDRIELLKAIYALVADVRREMGLQEIGKHDTLAQLLVKLDALRAISGLPEE